MKLSLEMVVIDCPEPRELADFYSTLMDVEVTSDHKLFGVRWVEIGTGETKVAFQEAPDLVSPDWPNPERPQQMHLDIRLGTRNDFEEADRKALDLGAKQLPGSHNDVDGGFQTYADPSGHPFCLTWGSE